MLKLGRSIKLAIARSAWDPAKMANQQDDIRLKMLCYAILAPNPHNKQPWLVELSGEDAITLYIDREHLLPMTDPLQSPDSHRPRDFSRGAIDRGEGIWL